MPQRRYTLDIGTSGCIRRSRTIVGGFFVYGFSLERRTRKVKIEFLIFRPNFGIQNCNSLLTFFVRRSKLNPYTKNLPQWSLSVLYNHLSQRQTVSAFWVLQFNFFGRMGYGNSTSRSSNRWSQLHLRQDTTISLYLSVSSAVKCT